MNFIPVKLGIVTGLLATLLAACAPAASGVPAAPIVVTRIVEVTAEFVTEVVVTATQSAITHTPTPIPTLKPARTPAPGKFAFKYNIDKSLPEDWVMEFKTIMQNLGEVLPIDPNIADYVKNNEMNIYAWISAVKNPFSERPDMGGTSISGNGSDLWMVLEINKDEFIYNILHRYSVIVHEYFHVYQKGLSRDAMVPKWLLEGGATVIEELYVQQYYGKSDLEGRISNDLANYVFTNPKLFEKYSTSEKDSKGQWMDMNYGGSTFMVLALIKELQKNGISEQRAFEMIFRDFWIENGKLPKISDSDGNNPSDSWIGRWRLKFSLELM